MFDEYGNWIDDEDEIDYSQHPELAPPNSSWDEEAGGWDTHAPGSEGYDPTYGGYTDPAAPGNREELPWLSSVYDAQGWDWPTAPDAPQAPTAPTMTPPGGGSRGGVSFGPLLRGYSGQFSRPTPGEAFKRMSDLLGPAPAFTARPLPTIERFEPTTAEHLNADPSFGFRKGIGEKALMNSRAAQGLLRTGGTLKDLLDYNQNFASQEFGNVDARRFRDYGMNRQNQFDLYDRGFQADRAEYEPKLFEWTTKGTLGSRAEEREYDNAFREFETDYDMWRNTQNDIFSRLKWASEFGLDAATR